MMPNRATRLIRALLLVAPLALGCGGPAHPPTYPAKGVVTYRDQPVPDADVTFLPIDGQVATGRTDPSGRFALTTYQTGDGATAGRHTVLIVKKEEVASKLAVDSPYAMTRNALPARYGQVNQSDLTAEVTAQGPNEFTFKLTD